MLFSPHSEMLMDDTYVRQTRKSLENEWRVFNMHDTVIIPSQHTVHQMQIWRSPKEMKNVANIMNRMPKILIEVLKPSWATGRFSTSGMQDCSRWEVGEWIKSKTRERLYFLKTERIAIYLYIMITELHLRVIIQAGA